MKKFFYLYVFLISILTGVPMLGVLRQIQKLPPDPYASTCRKCIMVAGTLSCECHFEGDEWKVQHLPHALQCPYSRVNEHGWLKCLPYGPYLDSCARCFMKGDSLYCMACKNRNDQTVQLLHQFSLSGVAECRYDVVNNNARLACVPQGPYLQYCNDCDVQNGILQCQCSMTPDNMNTLRPASLDLKSCSAGSMVYSNGSLKCLK